MKRSYRAGSMHPLDILVCEVFMGATYPLFLIVWSVRPLLRKKAMREDDSFHRRKWLRAIDEYTWAKWRRASVLDYKQWRGYVRYES